METILADLEVVEPRVARLQKDRSNPRELELLERVQAALEEERTLRALALGDEERKIVSGYSFLTLKPLLLVLSVAEDAVAGGARRRAGGRCEARARRGRALREIEMEIAQMPEQEQRSSRRRWG
jgi:ribosome-binding ATPase YchF (GTP1/OBG family)